MGNTIATVAATIAFKKAADEAVSWLKDKIAEPGFLKKFKVDQAYLKASNVENVKTIWNIESSVNLNEFYYPSKVIYLKSNTEINTIEVNALSDFPENGKIVVEGTAGQGKSILLRYLAGQELKSGSKIPLFIELRKISSNHNLESLIVNALSELDMEVKPTKLKYIFESNKFTLLLDAFDEIPQEHIQDTVSYVENMSNRFYSQQIVITSRPQSGAQAISNFSVYPLRRIEPIDFEPILSKLSGGNNDYACKVTKELVESNSGIAGLINTPLLLTLVNITYQRGRQVPGEMHEFYEKIFDVLIERHDSTKPGYKRHSFSGLSHTQLKRAFCGFSFVCSLDDVTYFDKDQVVDYATKGVKLEGITISDEFQFVVDCIKNTCLLVEEGFEYSFIHKSIREFHAAKYVSQAPIQNKQKFYELAVSRPKRFAGELRFLEAIDKIDFTQLFFIKSFELLRSLIANNSDNISFDSLSDFTLDVRYVTNGFGITIEHVSEEAHILDLLRYFYVDQWLYDGLANQEFIQALHAEKVESGTTLNFKMSDLAKNHSPDMAMINQEYSVLAQKYNRAKEFVSQSTKESLSWIV